MDKSLTRPTAVNWQLVCYQCIAYIVALCPYPFSLHNDWVRQTPKHSAVKTNTSCFGLLLLVRLTHTHLP